MGGGLSKLSRAAARLAANLTGMQITAYAPTIDPGALEAILRAEHGDPFAVLGMHDAAGQWVVRVFRPDARAVTVRAAHPGGALFPARQIHPDGFFEAVLEGATERFGYVLDFTGVDGA